MLVDLVRTNLETAQAILESVQDKNYIQGQDASDVAVLLGVISDKTFRMLEAFNRNA